MKKKILLTISMFILLMQSVLSQNFQWAKCFGGISYEDVYSVFTDPAGNNYITGDFCSYPTVFDTISLSPLGYSDIFIAKTDPFGHIIWVARAGGNNGQNTYESAMQIIKGNDSHIYFVGDFMTSAAWFDTVKVVCQGIADGFVAKYNDAGRSIWVKTISGSKSEKINTICDDSNQNTYIGGYFFSTSASIGPFTLTGVSANKMRIVLAKHNTDGDCLWAKQSTVGYAEAKKIICNGSRIYMTGYFNDSLTMEGITLVESSSWPMFIASFDTNGNIKWLHKDGGAGSVVIAKSLCADNSGNIYVIGYFQDTATFGAQTIIAPFSADMCIAKYDTAGNFIWVKQLNASGGATGKDIIADGNNGFYVTGGFNGSALFGTISMTSSATGDMFIAHYDNNGNCLGVRTVANAGAGAISMDTGGNCVVTGGFANSTSFDSYTISSHGSSDIFLAKLDAIIGIEDKSIPNNNNKLIIYANPNTGKCNITVPDDFLNEQELVLCVYDNTGKLIQRQSMLMEGSKIKLSLEAEAKGIYTATLSNGKKVYAGKIIFE